jgi:pimeloyl-ACP methyl ester carboxylesterase
MTISMLRSALYCILASLCLGPVAARTVDAAPASWSDVRSAAAALVEKDQFDDALALIERRATELEDREFEISDLRLEILLGAGRHEAALDVWKEGLDEGWFYFVIPRQQQFDAVRGDERFRALLERNNRLRREAQVGSRPEFEVVTPASYSPDRTYPLVMVIHGGNQSIVKSQGRWNPTAFGDDVLVAYLQSSGRADTKSYRWDLGGVDIYSQPKAQDEVLGLYREIVEAYPVDTEQITLVGFSQGGNLALFMAAEGTIPAKGMIAGCPATRSPVSPETARAAAERGLRGTIFVGATDWTAATAQTTVDNFAAAGLPIDHIVMEGKGHEFPDDFDALVRKAMADIYR